MTKIWIMPWNVGAMIKEDKFMQMYYENWKRTDNAKKMMRNWLLDPEGLLTGNGHVEGVYEFQYVNVKENMTSVKKAVYVALGIDIEGNKEILDFWIGDSESSSFWYGVLEELKLRGVKDIIYLCSDGVAGFKELLEQSFPKSIHQRCIVHIIRNLTKCLPRKNWQEFCNDLKTIYKSTDIESAKEASKVVLEKWKKNIILCKKLKQDIPHMLQLYDYTPSIR